MATESARPQTAIAFGGVTPVLRVADVTASIDYYTRVLGFHVDFKVPGDTAPFFASVTRGRCNLFLSEGDQGNPGAWVWIDGVNVAKVHEEYLASGARIRNPPTNYEWTREMQVEDLDGNILRIGSDPNKVEPIGEWLDMYGARWSRLPDGRWKRVEQG